MTPRDIELSSLYTGPINLWVEDTFVRDYLDALWNSPAIKYLIAGGKDGVRSVVKDAERLGYTHVFGLVDGDDRPGDVSHWSNPNKTFRTFVLPVHEIENYLLDAEALTGCQLNTIGKRAEELSRVMSAHAGQLCWWVACRAVLAELRHTFQDNFIPDPPASPGVDATAALAHIRASDWFQQLPGQVARWSEAEVERLLNHEHSQSQNAISDGSWVRSFPGKELFRHFRSQVFDSRKIPSPQSPTKRDLDIALARSVAEWQMLHRRIPDDLIRLHEALQRRIKP